MVCRAASTEGWCAVILLWKAHTTLWLQDGPVSGVSDSASSPDRATAVTPPVWRSDERRRRPRPRNQPLNSAPPSVGLHLSCA